MLYTGLTLPLRGLPNAGGIPLASASATISSYLPYHSGFGRCGGTAALWAKVFATSAGVIDLCVRRPVLSYTKDLNFFRVGSVSFPSYNGSVEMLSGVFRWNWFWHTPKVIIIEFF